MTKIEYIRAAKAMNLQFDDQYMSIHKSTIKTINRVIVFIIDKFKDGTFTDIKNKKNFVLNDGTELSQADFNKKYWKELFGDLEQRNNKGKARDQVTAYAVERIVSNANRNKKEYKNVKIPRIHDNKSLYIKSATVSINDDNLVLSSFLGEETTISFDPAKSRNIPELQKYRINKTKSATTGGNFHLQQRTFVAQIKKEKEPAYAPLDYLGFDINREYGKWLVFNKQHDELDHLTERPEDIHDLIVKIKDLNKTLADVRLPVSERKFRTKQRRKQRLRWLALHKQLDKLCRKIAQQIINVCIENKYCLCIDNLASGEKNGTFGQDHLVELLKTMCENQGIPFYAVPTPYTSQTCSACGYIDKENRKKNDFLCLECGHETDSHANAANNIANFGERLYDAGLPYSRLNEYPNNWGCSSIIKNFQKQSSKKQSLAVL